MNAQLRVFIVIAMLGVGCAPQDVNVADVSEPSDSGADGTADGPPCASTADCNNPKKFCKKPSCDSHFGTCAERFSVCGQDPRFVCGCRGTTFWNECYSDQAQENVRHTNECTDEEAVTCPGRTGDGCPVKFSYCSRLQPDDVSSLTCNPPPPPGLGKCTVLPTKCDGVPPDGLQWTACAPGGKCVDTCTAIHSGFPSYRDYGCSDN